MKRLIVIGMVAVILASAAVVLTRSSALETSGSPPDEEQPPEVVPGEITATNSARAVADDGTLVIVFWGTASGGSDGVQPPAGPGYEDIDIPDSLIPQLPERLQQRIQGGGSNKLRHVLRRQQ